MRSALPVVLLLLCAVLVKAQPAGFDLTNYGVSVEPDRRLIVVLAALEMAAGEGSNGADNKLLKTLLTESGVEFRDRLIKDLSPLPEDLRTKITIFVEQHKKRNAGRTDAEILAPFISMAYALKPVPELSDPLVTSDLPGSLLDVLDFAPLVREFYRRSAIAGKLDDYVKEYRLAADKTLRPSAKEMVSELLGYLNTRPRLVITEKIRIEAPKGKKTTLQQVETRETNRRFIIVPEKLAPKNSVTFVNVRDDYFVIAPPDTDLSSSEARRAYLQFVIDPLMLTYAKDVATMRDWAKPVIEERRKSERGISADIYLAIIRSIVAAIDVKQAEFSRIKAATNQARQSIALAKTDDEKRAVSADLEKFRRSMADESVLRLYEDYQKGAVLSFYFAEQFKSLEESGFNIESSLKEMIAAFDGAKASELVGASAEARSRAAAAREARRQGVETSVIVENPVTTKLIEIQKIIDAKDLRQASAQLKGLLLQYPAEPRIYYTMGRVAGLSAANTDDDEAVAAKLLEAKTAYENVVRTAKPHTDAVLLSLTYVALGRIYEHFDQKDYAIKLYDAAIQLQDVKGGGFKEALAAKQRLISPK
jgi:hypothetical protein